MIAITLTVKVAFVDANALNEEHLESQISGMLLDEMDAEVVRVDRVRAVTVELPDPDYEDNASIEGWQENALKALDVAPEGEEAGESTRRVR